MIVHILALVPPGANRSEAAKEVLGGQGARSITKEEFSTLSLTWSLFDVIGDGGDFVDQYYNPANQPAEVSALQLTNSQETWTDVPTSVFAFNDAGPTNRCPSLVKECPGR